MANETTSTQTVSPIEETKTTESSERRANNSSEVTDAQATIKIEGQEFELDSALAQDDKTLKTVLQPHFASIENASIGRDVKDGKLTVTIVKRAQHKGAQHAATDLPRYLVRYAGESDMKIAFQSSPLTPY